MHIAHCTEEDDTYCSNTHRHFLLEVMHMHICDGDSNKTQPIMDIARGDVNGIDTNTSAETSSV